jgi:hypothetical protein
MTEFNKLIFMFKHILKTNLNLEKEYTKIYKSILATKKYKNIDNNQITNQEANFTKILDDYTINWDYQPNGTQKSPDFNIIYKNTHYPVELKASRNKHIMLNDHWFKDNHIYVLSPRLYNKKDKIESMDDINNTIVALGRYIPSKEETIRINNLKSLIPKINEINRDKISNGDNGDNLYITLRMSNIYKLHNIDIMQQYKLLEEYIYNNNI